MTDHAKTKLTMALRHAPVAIEALRDVEENGSRLSQLTAGQIAMTLRRLLVAVVDGGVERDALLAGHAAEVEQLRQEVDGMARAPYGEYEKMRRQRDDAKRLLEQARAENDSLRGIASKVMPCHYCGADEIAKCPSGFPGCALMDDVMCMEESVVAALRQARADAETLRQENERLREQVLPDDMVCACLDETGSRTVTVWERCERCHAFMRMDEFDPVAAAQEPPAARPCARGEQPPAPDDRKIPSFHHPAQEPPALVDTMRGGTHSGYWPIQEPPAECPDCGLDLEPGEKHGQVEGIGCVAQEPPADGGDRDA